MIRFSINLKRAIQAVWNDIAPDAEHYVEDNESAVESCVDADRLAFFGHPSEDAEYKALCRKHGPHNVLKRLCQEVNLV